jgi:hypothetical protein
MPPFRHACSPDPDDPDAPCDCRDRWEAEGDRRYDQWRDREDER